MKLSKYKKGNILIGIINDLKSIKNKTNIFVSPCSEKVVIKIAKKAGISVIDTTEKGMVDIGEDISSTYDLREGKLISKLYGERGMVENYHEPYKIEMSDNILQKTKEFEKRSIPANGPSKTFLGEIFRSILFICYRSGNDGDLWYDIGSPSFMSYIFLKSSIDIINYSSEALTEEGDYSYEFTDKLCKENSYDGRVDDIIEELEDCDLIKYQLIDLMINGKIKDSKNQFDSRDYSIV